MLTVEGQVDPLIVGTNVLKPLIRQFKSDEVFWHVMGQLDVTGQEDNSHFFASFGQSEGMER